MPLPLQVKILRALQEREIEKVGGGAPMPVDVRVISATRQDLPQMMAEGSFREDLYYRLAVINMETVPCGSGRGTSCSTPTIIWMN